MSTYYAFDSNCLLRRNVIRSIDPSAANPLDDIVLQIGNSSNGYIWADGDYFFVVIDSYCTNKVFIQPADNNVIVDFYGAGVYSDLNNGLMTYRIFPNWIAKLVYIGGGRWGCEITPAPFNANMNIPYNGMNDPSDATLNGAVVVHDGNGGLKTASAARVYPADVPRWGWYPDITDPTSILEIGQDDYPSVLVKPASKNGSNVNAIFSAGDAGRYSGGSGGAVTLFGGGGDKLSANTNEGGVVNIFGGDAGTSNEITNKGGRVIIAQGNSEALCQANVGITMTTSGANIAEGKTTYNTMHINSAGALGFATTYSIDATPGVFKDVRYQATEGAALVDLMHTNYASNGWANGYGYGLPGYILTSRGDTLQPAWADPGDLKSVGVLTIYGDYTLSTDTSKPSHIRANSASFPISITFPPHADLPIPVGTVITVRRIGANAVHLVGGSGVTINTPATLNVSKVQGEVRLTKVGGDEWDASGDL